MESKIEMNSGLEVRHFRAADRETALGLIEREWGSRVTIVQSRTIWDGWWRGLWGARSVEVTAVRCTPSSPLDGAPRSQRPDDLAAGGCEAMLPAHLEDYRERFRRQLAGFREAASPASPDDSDGLDLRLFASLLDQHMDEELARRTLAALRSARGECATDDPTAREGALRGILASQIRTLYGLSLTPGRPLTAALVGPTGVGKTTTLAKLAAHFRLREKLHVGLITTDTYRVAAVEQLRTYAEIIDLPMEVVTTPREMRQAKARLGDCELVLIDTAGRNARAPLPMQEIRALLQAAGTDETILVLSATCDSMHLRRVAREFAAIDCTSLILTKLDESSGPGGAWSFLGECPLPLRYVTNGQSVPEDIRDADTDELVAMLLPILEHSA